MKDKTQKLKCLFGQHAPLYLIHSGRETSCYRCMSCGKAVFTQQNTKGCRTGRLINNIPY